MVAKGKFYNGYSPAERSAGGRAVRTALADGGLSWAASCSVCGCCLAPPHAWHLEQYSEPLSAVPVCGRCHCAIHMRFSRPDFWLRFLADLRQSCWVRHLSVDPASLWRPCQETYPDGVPSRGERR